MASLKDLNITLPKGMFLNRDGEKTLSKQINEVVTGYREETIKNALPILKSSLDETFLYFFGEMQRNDAKMFQNQTGELVSLTGYALAYNDVIVYKKNGRYAAYKNKQRNRGKGTNFISDQFNSLPKNTKVIYFKSKDITTLSLYLFSAAPHSSWVNYGLGTPKTSGQKRGVGWFDKYTEQMYSIFSYILQNEKVGAGIKPSFAFEGRSGGFRLTKK